MAVNGLKPCLRGNNENDDSGATATINHQFGGGGGGGGKCPKPQAWLVQLDQCELTIH